METMTKTESFMAIKLILRYDTIGAVVLAILIGLGAVGLLWSTVTTQAIFTSRMPFTRCEVEAVRL